MLENEGCCAVTFPGEAAANNSSFTLKNPFHLCLHRAGTEIKILFQVWLHPR